MEYIGYTFSQTEEFVLNMAIEKTIEATWCSREENVPALIYPRRIVENFFLFTLLSSLTRRYDAMSLVGTNSEASPWTGEGETVSGGEGT